jgi:hypothetical protein
MSRVNSLPSHCMSPALLRQIHLLETQHELYLRRLLDIEVHIRSDGTRVHRHPARQSPPRQRNNRQRLPNARGLRVPPTYPQARYRPQPG